MPLTPTRSSISYRFTALARPGEHFAASDQVPSWRRDALALAFLLAVGVGLKVWLLTHTEAMARDGIIYVTCAARLGTEPIVEVLKSTDQHPLYPLCILGMSRLVGAVQGELGPLGWQLSAQLANSVASWLMLFPVYFLGKELGSWKIGFWTALLYQCLPVVARFTADGVAEGIYLLCCAFALWSAVRGFRTKSWKWFALAGAGAGLAYLARPEGGLITPAVLLMLTLTWLRGAWEVSWRRAASCGLAVGLVTLIVAAPYWIALGRLSNKPSVPALFQSARQSTPVTAPTLLLAARFEESDGPWYALWQVLDEISKSQLYGIWGMTVLAMLGFAPHLLRRPGLGLLVLLMLLHVTVLWRLAVTRHYVSERHTVLIGLCSVCLAVYMWVHWETLWRNQIARVAAEGGRSTLERFPKPHYLLVAGISILCIWGAARTLRPLHFNRIALREAGLWLASHTGQGDRIIDPYGWPRFYANYEPRLGPLPLVPNREPQCFIVVDHQDDDRERIEMLRQALAERPGASRAFALMEGEKLSVVVYQAALH